MGFTSSDFKKWGLIRKLSIPEITLCTSRNNSLYKSAAGNGRTHRQDELLAGFWKGSYWVWDKTENIGAFYLIMTLLAKQIQ